MALRKILTEEDETLKKNSRPVTEVTDRIRSILDDMAETMHEANGVGLAAPQVGILRRMFVVQVDEDHLYELINPEIVESDGDQYGEEGCLSVPGKHATVTRPMKVRVRALDENMEEFTLTLEELEARCVLHENDHLDGILYVDKAEGPVVDNEE